MDFVDYFDGIFGWRFDLPYGQFCLIILFVLPVQFSGFICYDWVAFGSV